MQPFQKEVNIQNLVQGEKYYAKHSDMHDIWFRGVFSEYFTNEVGYNMVRFHNTFYQACTIGLYVGSKEQNIRGLYWRIFDYNQSFKFYTESRFTTSEKKELSSRCLMRERRQYELSLTGSTKVGLRLPSVIVRKIRQYIL